MTTLFMLRFDSPGSASLILMGNLLLKQQWSVMQRIKREKLKRVYAAMGVQCRYS
jgi:hypothetical protein